jgi:hypothetical protein
MKFSLVASIAEDHPTTIDAPESSPTSRQLFLGEDLKDGTIGEGFIAGS